jgi:two-component system NtrC family sensor kinase
LNIDEMSDAVEHSSKVKVGLAAKLAVCLVLSAAAIFAAFGFLNLRMHRKHSEELIVLSAQRLADIVRQSTRHEMLRNDREALYATIRDMGNEPGIRRLRIFNKEGRITFSTDDTELGQVVDKNAEACYACHAQGVPLIRLNRPDQARVFYDTGRNERVLGMIEPVRNEPSCSNAACHAHPQEKQVLGVIDVQLSMAAVDQQSADQQSMLVWFSVAAVVLLSGISIWFVYAVLHRPIKALIRGTHRVAGGDLAYRLNPAWNDELGDLANSFNKMTAELADAHSEITAWTEQLEDRVYKKTEELERAHAFLVSSEKMASIGKLAATVAHEVNNPLFGILTYARLCLKELEKPELDAATRERMLSQLRIIERESRRCGDIIKNLLTYTRQAPRKREPNSMNAIVDRATILVRHQLKLQNITLEVSLAEDLPDLICDAGQIQQVILILLTNAAEATGTDGHLWVTTQREGDSAVRLSVRDDGGGVPPEILAQIFDPFFTTKEDQLRTGLGLAVAKSIVEQHGGTVEVESQPGKGAEFIITLPLEAPKAAAAGTAFPAGSTA